MARIVIYGIGAVGGVIAAALAASGQQVLGIARGAQLDAIRANGLTLHTPSGKVETDFPVVGAPGDIDWRADDLVLLAVKSQHTADCLSQLAASGFRDQHVFCAQNGVANERMAAEVFANVHGIMVVIPGTYTTPGEVVVHGQPNYGILDIGRYPQGSDAADAELARAMTRAKIAGFAHSDVMSSKRGKLLMNLGNVLEAALGGGADTGDLRHRARTEAESVFRAADLAWDSVDEDDPRRDSLMKMAEVPGLPRRGGSTAQSLLRGTGNLETRWLNGEIVELGAAHGVATPVNAALLDLAERLLRDGLTPGDMTLEQVQALVTA